MEDIWARWKAFCVHSSHLLKLRKSNNQKGENEINQVKRNKDIHRNEFFEKNMQ